MKLRGEYVMRVETLQAEDADFSALARQLVEQQGVEVGGPAIDAVVVALRERYPTAGANCNWTRPRPPAAGWIGWTVWREASLRPKAPGEASLFAPPTPPKVN
jgi:hypothetical protein